MVASTETESVRCTACREEYELPPRGVEPRCPECGALVWVSAGIPLDPPESGTAFAAGYARLM